MRQQAISRRLRSLAIALVACVVSAGSGLAEGLSTRPLAPNGTLPGALAQAYHNNPQLNAERALLRSIDETVPQALSGYRPQISASADTGVLHTRTESVGGGVFESTTAPYGFGLTGTQVLFNGLRTANRTRAAESQVFAGREALRLIEQQVLLDAATAYVNVLRDIGILDLQRRNVEVLEEQLRQTRDRFNVGEVTRTDVAQGESRLAASRSAFLGAEANLSFSRATYRRIIGVEPGRLVPAMPVERFSPNTLSAAITAALGQNPQVQAAAYGIDVQSLQVKIAEGALYPTLAVQGNLQQRFDTSVGVKSNFAASAVAQLVIPIYQGGGEYSLIRQLKETVGQRRFDLETLRDQVRALVVQAWGSLQAAKAQIQAAHAQVSASEVALDGVRQEARVGQRTTLDVLNAQQELVNARVNLVIAQRDRIVASYLLLAGVGRLSAKVLGLKVHIYDPVIHYHQVRDAWSGVRIPDGR